MYDGLAQIYLRADHKYTDELAHTYLWAGKNILTGTNMLMGWQKYT